MKQHAGLRVQEFEEAGGSLARVTLTRETLRKTAPKSELPTAAVVFFCGVSVSASCFGGSPTSLIVRVSGFGVSE